MVPKSPRRKIKHPYVTRKKGVSGGKPIIAGTRIKVAQVAVECERMGLTPDQIVQAHPHLALALVHDALAYYYENAEAINADIQKDEELVQAMLAKSPRSVLEARRGAGQNLNG